jgi:hypothetical protein
VAAPGGAQRRQRDGAVRIDSCDRRNAPRLGRAARAPRNGHAADTGGKTYKYATLGKTLLIVNPTDRVIVDVITG